MNIDYSQFYRGTTNIPSYGNSPCKKDTLVKYEFKTTDEKGSKVMDKMSKEETMKALNDISAQYGENVIVEFSGDGLAALAESKKLISNKPMTEEETAAKKAKDEAFQSEIHHYDKSISSLPSSYSEIHGTTNTLDMMRTMDRKAYEEYQNIDKSKEGGLTSLKYLINWYTGAIKKNPSIVDTYEKTIKKNNFSGANR